MTPHPPDTVDALTFVADGTGCLWFTYEDCVYYARREPDDEWKITRTPYDVIPFQTMPSATEPDKLLIWRTK